MHRKTETEGYATRVEKAGDVVEIAGVIGDLQRHTAQLSRAGSHTSTNARAATLPESETEESAVWEGMEAMAVGQPFAAAQPASGGVRDFVAVPSSEKGQARTLTKERSVSRPARNRHRQPGKRPGNARLDYTEHGESSANTQGKKRKAEKTQPPNRREILSRIIPASEIAFLSQVKKSAQEGLMKESSWKQERSPQ